MMMMRSGWRSCHDNMCRHINVLIFILFVILFSTTCMAQEGESSYSYSGGSEDYLLPCIYRGIPRLHGEEWTINDCTICSCVNATISCVIQGCQPVTCEDKIHPPGACCPMCSYHVNVSRVVPAAKVISAAKLQPAKLNRLNLNVSIDFHETELSTGVHGENLWNMSIWMSRNSDGSGPAFGVAEDVLSSFQRDTRYRKGRKFPKLRDIKYDMDAQDLTCLDMKFICVRFDQADKPMHQNYEYVPFFFGGYPNDNALTGCMKAPRCRALRAIPKPTLPRNIQPRTKLPEPITTPPLPTTPPPRPTTPRPRPTTPRPRPTAPRPRSTTTRPRPTTFWRPWPTTTPLPIVFTTIPYPTVPFTLPARGGWSSSEEIQESAGFVPNLGTQQRMNNKNNARKQQKGNRKAPKKKGGQRKTLGRNAKRAGLTSGEAAILRQKKLQQRARNMQNRWWNTQTNTPSSSEQIMEPAKYGRTFSRRQAHARVRSRRRNLFQIGNHPLGYSDEK